MLKYAGFNPTGAEKAGGVSLQTALTMKDLIIGLQVVGFVIALIIFCFYPITRERAAKTRLLLDQRRQNDHDHFMTALARVP